MTSTSFARSWFRSLTLVVALGVPLTALAEDVVHLKGGGSIRGDVMELIPNQYVNLRLLDGTSRRIEWAQIERVEEDSAASAAPNVPPPPIVIAPQGASPEDAAKREALRAEIARLEVERTELRTGGPVVMMIAGGASFFLVLPIGLSLWAVSSVCTDDFDSGSGSFDTDCDNSGLQTAGIVVTALGVVGTAIGVVGLVQLIGIGGDRREINDQINIRQQQLNALSYDLHLGPQRADLTLRVQF